MGQIVVTMEGGGVVSVERHTTPLIDLAKGGKQLVDLIRKGEGPNPIKAATETADFVLAVAFVEQSEFLSDDEKRAARRTLFSFDPTFDSITFNRRPGTRRASAGEPEAPAPGADQGGDAVLAPNFWDP